MNLGSTPGTTPIDKNSLLPPRAQNEPPKSTIPLRVPLPASCAHNRSSKCTQSSYHQLQIVRLLTDQGVGKYCVRRHVTRINKVNNR